MRWVIVLSLMTLLISSGCDIFDECYSSTEVVLYNRSGPPIDDPVELIAGETYTYDLKNAVYITDQEGGGRATCPQRNKRLPEIDSLVVEDASVASAEVVNESILQLRAVQSGSTTVTVYMSATVTGEHTLTLHPSVSTTMIIE